MDTSSNLLVVFGASYLSICPTYCHRPRCWRYSNSIALHWHWKLGRILDWQAGSETILVQLTHLIHLLGGGRWISLIVLLVHIVVGDAMAPVGAK